MSNIINEKYNVDFDLKFDSFYNFFESLKESKKYYQKYCKLENINIEDFDNEYLENINSLKGELLKYYILITNDDTEKYITLTDTIKDFYKFMIEQFNQNTFIMRELFDVDMVE